MKFIDEAIIAVRAGHGGRGAKSFRREKYVPFGGPDGGNGGAGGSVILKADRSKGTLLDFQFRPRWEAQDGEPGGGSGKDGKSAEDLVIVLPVGTEVYKLTSPDDSRGELVCDLTQHGQEFVLAKGGRGGKGNAFFKSSTNQVPEHFQPGERGEAGSYLLSLKLVADIGLVGFPNAGKSTLISRISAARPKIADYPFTTLTPNLGAVQLKGGRSLIVADIPGLIPGAHEGRGLGTKFLKHIERTHAIAHVIDPNQLDEAGNQITPLQSFEIVQEELRLFSPLLAAKPHMVLFSKLDTQIDRSAVQSQLAIFRSMNIPAHAISSVSGEGIETMLESFAQLAAAAKNTEIA